MTQAGSFIQKDSMAIEEKFVEAPLQKVWDFIMNPANLGSVSQAAKVEAIDERNLSVVKVKVGPLSKLSSTRRLRKWSHPI
jgi:carbon monoxide dehydrogenase subunit G